MGNTRVSLFKVGWLTVALLLTFAACGVGETSATVRLSGVVFSDFKIDRACAKYVAPDEMPEELSGIELSFQDSEGRVLGATTTGVLETEDLDDGCRFSAAYEISLDRTESYTVAFDPPDQVTPGGMYYDGANALEAQTVKYQTLSDNGMTWDFEAPPQWVTP